MSTDDDDYILALRCPDRPGILAAVTGCLFGCGCDIRDAAQFGDSASGQFFVRIHLRCPSIVGREKLPRALKPIARRLKLDWRLSEFARKLKTLIAVSQQGHCLNDLLHRWHSGRLHTEIVGVVSNHQVLRPLVEWHGLPYHYLPVNPANKSRQERAWLSLLRDTKADLVVLARYMQILPPAVCTALAGRCINIHHSFLPGFKGARPYHKAYERGVKLIGATAHYVTTDLDEGPIIEQDIRRVTHATSPEEMAEIGRETEASVLARAVRWHLEHRVLLNGRRTVVFN